MLCFRKKREKNAADARKAKTHPKSTKTTPPKSTKTPPKDEKNTQHFFALTRENNFPLPTKQLDLLVSPEHRQRRELPLCMREHQRETGKPPPSALAIRGGIRRKIIPPEFRRVFLRIECGSKCAHFRAGGCVFKSTGNRGRRRGRAEWPLLLLEPKGKCGNAHCQVDARSLLVWLTATGVGGFEAAQSSEAAEAAKQPSDLPSQR